MKKVFFFMALAVAGLAMTACGGNKEDDKKADEAIATDSKALAQAFDNVMKATDDTKIIATYDEFEKIAKDLTGKYKGNKEFGEACDKELKELGYDVNDIRNIMMEMSEKVNNAKMNIESGALMDEPGDMNEDMDHDMPDEMDINMDMED